MDLKLSAEAGKLTLVAGEMESSFINNIILSLEIPLGKWWFNPSFGSKLYLLRREKATPATAKLTKDYIEEALQWLISSGKFTSIDVTVELAKGRINYMVSGVTRAGEGLTYSNFVEVA